MKEHKPLCAKQLKAILEMAQDGIGTDVVTPDDLLMLMAATLKEVIDAGDAMWLCSDCSMACRQADCRDTGGNCEVEWLTITGPLRDELAKCFVTQGKPHGT